MMRKRKIIKIDEDKCTGCGECIPNCPEGALQVIDGKVRLVSDLFCDGLGACLGYCPEGAILVEEREAEPYDEVKVMDNIVKQGPNIIKAHLLHLKEHNDHLHLKEAVAYLNLHSIQIPQLVTHEESHHVHGTGCPGAAVKEFKKKAPAQGKSVMTAAESELTHWPVQLMLVPPFAPFLKNAHLLITADCVPFAYADFHQDLLKDNVLLVGCPKFDDVAIYENKIISIIKQNNIQSITCAHMEVPCCFGLKELVETALKKSGKEVPLNDVTITIKGEKKS